MVSLNNKAVQQTRLELDSKLTFQCKPGISCFTRCCRNIEVLLTPYDVIRMKNRLGLPSTEFLARYTYFKEDMKTTHPLIYLKMNDDEEKLCPFVEDGKGCTIYTDRPAACRYYPVGQATHRVMGDDNETPTHDEWYVLVREDHCRGFEEEKEWTIQEWRDDQEASLADDMNREWKSIMMKQSLPKEDEDKPRRQKMFYLASYDLDSFRRYVYESRFLEIFDVGPELIEKMKTDDVELMHFAFRYLKYMLAISEELKLKPHVAEAQRRQIEEGRAREEAARNAREAEILARKEAEAEEGVRRPLDQEK